MSDHRSEGWSRREFLAKATLAGTAGFLGLKSSSSAAEPPLETNRIRLSQVAGICPAPQYVAKELLTSEGFTDIEYVFAGVYPYLLIGSGAIDISMAFVAPFLVELEAGAPITLLGGVHIGCCELSARRNSRDPRPERQVRRRAGHGFSSSSISREYVGVRRARSAKGYQLGYS